MYNSFTQSDLRACIEQTLPGQTCEIPLSPHPILIAYLLFDLNDRGPHILVSTQNQLLSQIHQALLFFEPEQKVCSFLEETNHTPENENSWLQMIAHAQKASKNDIFMISPQHLIQKTISPKLFKEKSFALKRSENLPDNITILLTDLGYFHQDRVEKLGDFSIRGNILDIFSALHGPLRLELTGEEINQIKLFNINTQRSYKEINTISITPVKEWSVYNKEQTYKQIKKIISHRKKEINESFSFQKWNHFLRHGALSLYTQESLDRRPSPLQKEEFTENQPRQTWKEKTLYNFFANWKTSFVHQSPFTILDHFSTPLIWNLDEPNFLKEHLSSWKSEIERERKESKIYPSFTEMYIPQKRHEAKRELVFDPFSQTPSTSPLTSSLFPKNFFKTKNWTEKIKEQRRKRRMVFLLVEKEQKIKEIKSALEMENIKLERQKPWFEMKEEQQTHPHIIHIIKEINCEHLIWLEENILFLKADSFSYFPQKKEVFLTESTQALSFSFSELTPGDLVVHRQYGIGLFRELKIFNFGLGESEFLVLKYKEGDLLYIPVYAFHLIQKYSGPISSNENLLDKLGDKKWLNTKEKVKKRIKDMTMELMSLYSLRSSLKRKRFLPSGDLFKKFTNEFPFVETPDQKKAIEDILKDLTQKEQPADRLICGDTGFGKTEVALRAAFKVIEEGFQVGIMAPTTILSFQHFDRFKERLKNWPMTVRLINRFTSAKERKEILKDTKEGKVDILIGTHRILSRDIQFKKLGLLIIDEEHLFGVKSKEKIKHWYSHVDTISLSATPIPRSLSMSLSGLRDMSLILTPPLNRKSVHTFIKPFSGELIKKAISKELERDGQIIFIHNRIADIYRIEEQLKELLPSLRIQTAHGKRKDLQEKVVLDFFQRKFDLLLCTTIIESGMDFPNANTLFINQSDQFGLSQLHQLRGRIGRSDRQSYCYLLIDPRKRMSQKALERLKIIQENHQPGSGITIAQYDLEMRGGGELMGAEQSGFLQNVGYEMYFEFLQENISALKGEKAISPEPDLQFKQPAFIPCHYIPHEKMRLVFYKKLASASSKEEIEKIKTELEDFAGPLPIETTNLFLLNQLRLIAKSLHARELSYKNPWLYISFVESSPLSHLQIAKWVQEDFCHLHNQNTLKFFLKEENLEKILKISEELVSSLKF